MSIMDIDAAPASTSTNLVARILDVADRCDRCGAQAFVQAIREDMPEEILFCAHHGREHAPALGAKGWKVSDQSHRINEKAGASA